MTRVLLLMLLGALLNLPTWAWQEEKDDKDKAEIEVEMVVSASRKAEKKLEAPVTIEAVPAAVIEESAQPTPLDAAATMKGVDYVKGGLNYQRVSARGFSTSYQERMLSMVDGKLATLPGAGTPQGFLQPTVPLDVKGVEVVLGPASALYGANASAGVYNVLTKSPWDEKGTAVSARVGEQSLVNLQLRHAGVHDNGKFAWKIVAEYLTGDDFDSDNVYFADGSNQTTHTAEQTAAALRRDDPNPANWAWREDELASLDVNSKKYEANFYYNVNEDWRIGANYGWSENDALTTTNLGRNRLEDWEIKEYGIDIFHPNFYFQYNHTENAGGNTFGVQNVPPFLAAGLPQDAVVNDPTRALVYDASELDDMEIQFNYDFGVIDMVAGASYREYAPDSFGTYLDDFRGPNGEELAPIKRDETGYYVQFDARLMDEKLRITGAVRQDDSNEYDSQTSPKFSIAYNGGNHNFRLGYNQAHRDPSILENHLFFAGGVALGNGRGWRVQSLVTGEIVAEYDALVPEEVKTIEAGYRGVLGGGVFIDLVYYQSDYSDFISALQTIAFALHPTNPTVAIDADGNVHPVVLTYLNYGEADVYGYDIGLDWYYGDHFHLNASYGFSKLDEFINPTPIPDLPYNTPESKIKLAFTWKDIVTENTFLKITARNVDEYNYISGRWVATDASPGGPVESRTTIDLATGYTWEAQQLSMKLGVTNVTDEDSAVLPGIPAARRLIALEVMKKF